MASFHVDTNTKALAGAALFFVVMFISACAVSKDPLRKPARALQKGKITEDTSYVYSLPYDSSNAYLVVQGYFSPYSHKDRAAIDFKMKRGTRILASRRGVVVQVKSDGTKGGISKKYRAHGNHIIIQHEDESRSSYWHLQHNGVNVKVGDTVMEGQFIGLSGKTGYALFPHLHFSVSQKAAAGKWVQSGCRFRTSKGNLYLRPFRRYSYK